MKILQDPYMTETIQTKYPKRKCRRLVKKFRKRYTKTIPSRKYVMFNDMIVVHPVLYEEIKRLLPSGKYDIEYSPKYVSYAYNPYIPKMEPIFMDQKENNINFSTKWYANQPFLRKNEPIFNSCA